MPDSPGKAVAVSCRTGSRIRQTPCTDYNSRRFEYFPVGRLDPADPFLPDAWTFRGISAARVGKDLSSRCVIYDLNAFVLQCFKEGGRDIRCMIADRENTVSSFSLDMAAVFFKELHHVGRRKRIDRMIQELPAVYDGIEKIFHVAGIGEVASAFACNVDLLSRLLVLFQQQDPDSPAGSTVRRQHSRCTCAYHNDIIHFR